MNVAVLAHSLQLIRSGKPKVKEILTRSLIYPSKIEIRR